MDKENYVTINDEGLAEVSPTASRDAQLAFIDNFRQLQGENTAQIGTQTHALGSDLTAPYGGLHGPSEYMRSRYQTPQTESRVAAMRTAAQLSALNQLMQNDQNRWDKRYNKAYSDYQRRKAGSGNNGNTTGNNQSDPDIEKKILASGDLQGKVRSNAPGTTPVWDMSWNSKTGQEGIGIYDSATDKKLKTEGGEGTTYSTSASAPWMGLGIGSTAVGALNPLYWAGLLGNIISGGR